MDLMVNRVKPAAAPAVTCCPENSERPNCASRSAGTKTTPASFAVVLMKPVSVLYNG